MKLHALVVSAALLVAQLAAAAPGASKPQLVFSIAQSKEVVETKGGVTTRRMVPTQSAVPGDVVEYVLTYTNKGDEAATNAVVDDPIPHGTIYVASSATGDGALITFSADGGKTFAEPVKLSYEVRLPSGAVEKRVATPAEYTHIRWTIPKVAPGATGTVAFRVQVR
jgi:uncharacterized repeat protein (TIGR01451 family)